MCSLSRAAGSSLCATNLARIPGRMQLGSALESPLECASCFPPLAPHWRGAVRRVELALRWRRKKAKGKGQTRFRRQFIRQQTHSRRPPFVSTRHSTVRVACRHPISSYGAALGRLASEFGRRVSRTFRFFALIVQTRSNKITDHGFNPLI